MDALRQLLKDFPLLLVVAVDLLLELVHVLGVLFILLIDPLHYLLRSHLQDVDQLVEFA